MPRLELRRDRFLINRLRYDGIDVDRGVCQPRLLVEERIICERIIGKRVVCERIIGERVVSVSLIDQRVELTAQITAKVSPGVGNKLRFNRERVVKDSLDGIDGVVASVRSGREDVFSGDVVVCRPSTAGQYQYR